MPCCGLAEFRVKVPAHLVIAGVALFWTAFFVAFLCGVALVWLPVGRGILASQREFLRAFWLETMRQPGSAPARWSCRFSGYLLPISPSAARLVYQRPELPLVFGALVLLSVAGGLASYVFT